MPKVSYSSENKVSTNQGVNKLTLDRGERALILCIEEPTTEFRHIYEAPELDPTGQIVKEIKQNWKKEDYEAPKMEFFGQHLCLGDFGTVVDKGIDPANCPGCKAVEDGEGGIKKPQQHYAMHVIRYALQPGSFTVRDPFSVELIPWAFSGTRLNTLIEIAEDLEKKGETLKQHDLRLGPCDSKQFQKYEIHVSLDAAWLSGGSDDEINARKQIVAQTYKNNQLDDIATIIAKRATKGEALEMIHKTVERYNEAYHRTASTQVPDLSQLKRSDDKPQTEVKSSDGLDVFSPETPGEAAAGENFKVDTTTGEVTETASAPKTELKQMDFADILEGL